MSNLLPLCWHLQKISSVHNSLTNRSWAAYQFLTLTLISFCIAHNGLLIFPVNLDLGEVTVEGRRYEHHCVNGGYWYVPYRRGKGQRCRLIYTVLSD